MLLPDLDSLLSTSDNVRGIGTDIVEIAEFRQLPFGTNRRFYERIFTPGEIEYCLGFADPYERFAARFAAKEAVLKALGGEVLLDQIEIEVTHHSNGQPWVKLHTPTPSGRKVLLSLSHSLTYALAFAVIIQD